MFKKGRIKEIKVSLWDKSRTTTILQISLTSKTEQKRKAISEQTKIHSDVTVISNNAFK